MNIQQTIKTKLNSTSKLKVIKLLGYNSTTKGLKTLELFLNQEALSLWLKSGHYDFKYTTEQFLINLCKVLEIDDDIIQVELERLNRYYEELDRYRGCHIYINTNFRRKNEPIFALAFCEFKRRIKLNLKDLIYKSGEEIFEYISHIVKKHYVQENGKIGIWGKIVNYVFHHKDDKTFVFDTDGKLVENIVVAENRAILTLK